MIGPTVARALACLTIALAPSLPAAAQPVDDSLWSRRGQDRVRAASFVLQRDDVTGRCEALRSPYFRSQVERAASLSPGSAWPAGWRETNGPALDATRVDRLAARALGMTIASPREIGTLPDMWVAFVVDSTGRVVPCSVRADISQNDGLLGRIRELTFRPARRGARAVVQVVMLRGAR